MPPVQWLTLWEGAACCILVLPWQAFPTAFKSQMSFSPASLVEHKDKVPLA